LHTALVSERKAPGEHDLYELIDHGHDKDRQHDPDLREYS